jgi:acyl carrier protein
MLLDKVKRILSELFVVPADSITLKTSLRGDLNASSIDLVELVMEFEEEFGLAEPADDDDSLTKLQTVNDIIEYLTPLVSENDD